MASRTQYTIKNLLWGNLSQIVHLLVKFVSRTVFIYYLGQTYMGINGLFTNVLGVLSFAELGIGTAMNYALYKPVAANDREKIKSLMSLYKKAYRIIALIIAAAGLLLLPFLDMLIKDPGNIGNIRVYYLLYLFDTATSYLVSYKYALVAAEQKSYIVTNITTVVTLFQTIAQIIVMLFSRSFLLYLIVTVGVSMLQKIFNAVYLNIKYPYLNEPAKKLETQEISALKKNVFALIIHKVGDVCVHQTDNILITLFVSVAVTGKISNYNYIITTVTGFLSVIFSSVIGSLGNLIASESRERQFEIFKTYRFVGFWLYGFCAIAFYVLFQPFITIWAGSEWLVDELTVALICLERYNVGHRVVINNFKSAAGVFDQDKWVAFGQALLNLIISVVMVNWIGLPGIYIGTICQGLLSTAIRPHILYRDVFGQKTSLYFRDSLKYIAAEFLAIVPLVLLRHLLIGNICNTNLGNFILLVIATAIIPNALFTVFFYKTPEFSYIRALFIPKILSKFKRERSEKIE